MRSIGLPFSSITLSLPFRPVVSATVVFARYKEGDSGRKDIIVLLKNRYPLSMKGGRIDAEHIFSRRYYYPQNHWTH